MQVASTTGVSALIPVTISRLHASETLLTPSSSSVSAGEPVSLTAKVAGETPGAGPTGTVTFATTGGAPLGSASVSPDGSATLSGVMLPLGVHEVGASYSGDATHAGSLAPNAQITVSKQATTTTLTASTAAAEVGGELTLSAEVTGGSPTGSVEFVSGETSLGTATLAGGVATLTTKELTAGEHAVFAVYSGDALHAASESADVTVAVAAGRETKPVAPGRQVVAQTGAGPQAETRTPMIAQTGAGADYRTWVAAGAMLLGAAGAVVLARRRGRAGSSTVTDHN